MLWLAEGLGLSAVMLATAGLLIRVLNAVGTGRLPRATLALMLAAGAGLVALAFHISNPDRPGRVRGRRAHGPCRDRFLPRDAARRDPLLPPAAMTLRRRAETLERLQRIFQRQLAIDQELDRTRQHLREWERSLDERARPLEEWEAALDTLEQAHQSGDPEQVRSCRQRLDQARQAYHEQHATPIAATVRGRPR